MLRLMDLRRLRLLPLAGIFLLGCATLGTLGSGGVEVGSTAAPGSPPPPMPAASGTTEPLATRLPAGSYRFTAGQAGVVTIRLSGGGVALESMEPNDGWSHRPDGSDAEGATQPPEHLLAAHPRQDQVQDDEVRIRIEDQLQASGAVVGVLHQEAVRLQATLHERSDARLVLDHHDAHRWMLAGGMKGGRSPLTCGRRRSGSPRWVS